MHDSRRGNRVERPAHFSIMMWWLQYKFWFKNITLLLFTFLAIFKPEVLVNKLTTWLNTIYTTFNNISTITLEHWIVIMSTLLVFAIVYRLYKWGRKD